MFNNKKLYITGAGASKDLNSKMLLGADIVEDIKQLRFRIYYELIALVTIKIAVSEKGAEIYARCLNDVVKKFLQKKHDFRQTDQYNEIKGNPQIITEFIQDLENVLDLRKIIGEYHKKEIVRKSIDFLLGKDKVRNIFMDLVLFSTSPLDNKEKVITFNNALDKIIDFIFNPAISKTEECQDWQNNRKDLQNELKKYTIYGIILSIIIDDFDSTIYSIDCLINFLPSITYYNDNYAEKYNLPKVDEIKKFAEEYVANIIGKNIECYPNNQNWINYLEAKLFLNTHKQLESKIDEISFINFNYDCLIESHFRNKSSLANLNERQESLKKLNENIGSSHIYGIIKTYGGSHGLIENIADNMSWIIKNDTKDYRQITFGNNDNSEEKIIQENSKDELEKIMKKSYEKKEKNKISFIRIDFDIETIKNNFAKIENSDEIYILGFGFDEYNLQNIGICANDNLEKITNKTVYATNYGDLPRIRLALERIFAVKLYKESELQEDGKKHSFWRSRDDATNKRNNNVFVSTKPVYRALTEDFLA